MSPHFGITSKTKYGQHTPLEDNALCVCTRNTPGKPYYTDALDTLNLKCQSLLSHAFYLGYQTVLKSI